MIINKLLISDSGRYTLCCVKGCGLCNRNHFYTIHNVCMSCNSYVNGMNILCVDKITLPFHGWNTPKGYGHIEPPFPCEVKNKFNPRIILTVSPLEQMQTSSPLHATWTFCHRQNRLTLYYVFSFTRTL